MNNKLVIRTALVVWVVLWASFHLRGFFRGNLVQQYRRLYSGSTDERHSLVNGPIYPFLTFIAHEVPLGTTFDFVGLAKDSHDYRRAVYFLYPRISCVESGYIFVFQVPGYARKGYVPFKEFDNGSYILKRAGI